MKWTPQKAIVDGVGRGRLAREPERVAGVVGDVLDLGQLVVVGEDHRVALGGERAHLAPRARSISSGERSSVGIGGLDRRQLLHRSLPRFRMFAGTA